MEGVEQKIAQGFAPHKLIFYISAAAGVNGVG